MKVGAVGGDACDRLFDSSFSLDLQSHPFSRHDDVTRLSCRYDGPFRFLRSSRLFYRIMKTSPRKYRDFRIVRRSGMINARRIIRIFSPKTEIALLTCKIVDLITWALNNSPDRNISKTPCAATMWKRLFVSGKRELCASIQDLAGDISNNLNCKRITRIPVCKHEEQGRLTHISKVAGPRRRGLRVSALPWESSFLMSFWDTSRRSESRQRNIIHQTRSLSIIKLHNNKWEI